MTVTVPDLRPLLQTPRIYLDFGAIGMLGVELGRLGASRPLLVTDATLASLATFGRVRDAFPGGAPAAVFAEVPPNPTVAAVHACIAAWRAAGCDAFVALGGGSVIDCAKSAALLATHDGDLSHYLGHPERIVRPPAPLIAVPTTAGSGSEVSRGCGIHPDATTRALGINHPLMVPRVALCDPELTLTLPPHLTAGTGLDALSHCIEGFLARAVNPLVDAIALDGVRRVVAHIARAVQNGQDREARWQLMMAAVEGGLSIAKGLGPAHAIANTCGDRDLHHGMMATLALPHVLRLCEARVPARLPALAEAMGCAPGTSIADRVDQLNVALGLPRTIAALGYGQANLEEMADDAAASFFNAATAYRPTRDEYREMLRRLVV